MNQLEVWILFFLLGFLNLLLYTVLLQLQNIQKTLNRQLMADTLSEFYGQQNKVF